MKKGLIVAAGILLLLAVVVWAADEHVDYDMGTTANNPHGMRKWADGNFPLPLVGLSRSMPGDSACTSSAFDISEFTHFTTCWDADTTVGPGMADDDSVFLGVYFEVSQDASNWIAWDSIYDTTGGANYLEHRCKAWTADPACPYGRFIFAGQTRNRTAAAGAESTQSDSIVLSKVYHTFQQ